MGVPPPGLAFNFLSLRSAQRLRSIFAEHGGLFAAPAQRALALACASAKANCQRTSDRIQSLVVVTIQKDCNYSVLVRVQPLVPSLLPAPQPGAQSSVSCNTAKEFGTLIRGPPQSLRFGRKPFGRNVLHAPELCRNPPSPFTGNDSSEGVLPPLALYGRGAGGEAHCSPRPPLRERPGVTAHCSPRPLCESGRG